MSQTKPAIDNLRDHLGPRARSYAVGSEAGWAKSAARLAERIGGTVLDTEGLEVEGLDAEGLDAEIPGDDSANLDACIWCAGPGEALPPRTLGLLRQQLTATGRLLVLRPLTAEPTGSTSGPMMLRASIQDLVVGLSAAGFVRLDQLALEPIDSLPHAEGWALVVARVAPLTVRGYRPGDEVAISHLFTQSFHAQRPDSAWRWKFLEHPWGQRVISLAWDGDMLRGQYAATPMRLVRAEGGEDRALQLCDIMTSPAVRSIGRGPTAVLSRMLRHLYATRGEQRIGFVIGFNTATSRAFALRFTDGHELEPVAFWQKDVAPSAQRQTSPGKRYRIEVIDRFGGRFDRFFDRVAPAYDYLQRRDAVYLSWRFAQPGVDYLPLAAYRFGRLVGWSIFRRQEDELVWGDALVDPRHPDAARSLLAAAEASAHGTGVARVTGWFAARPAWWREMLAELDFEPRPEPNDLSLIYGLHSEPAAGDLLAHWYYTKADSDLF